MATGIFPKRDADFNTYFGTALSYLNTHAVRLQVAAGNLTDLGAIKVDWDVKFPLTQSSNTSTTTLVEEKNELRDDAEELLRKIYGDIPQSLLTLSDRNTLNLKERKQGSPRPAITTEPILILQAMPGAFVKFTCRVEGDSSRPSLHPDADGVELKASILSEPPVNPETDLRNIVFSSKASFKSDTDINQIGKRLYAMARWKNNSDDAKSGPWCPVQSVMLIE
jgi:hypothetical protein